jgi:beta-galactosidase
LQAVAHGSDSVQYFQWRAGRGGVEQFHGAVLDHAGTEATRVFGEVAGLGKILAGLDEIVGTTVPARAAVIFDWENRWALEAAAAARPSGPGSYEDQCRRHYRSMSSRGVAIDIIDMEQGLSGYTLVAAPLLFMLRENVAERLERFVRSGGTLVTTYRSGMVDAAGLCFTGGFPGPLRSLLGIWAEEIDELYPGEGNHLVMRRGNPLGLAGRYSVSSTCALVRAESAQVLASYTGDFYRGRPALTMNALGEGRAFYLAADAEDLFLTRFYAALSRNVPRAPVASLPEGVSAQVRADESRRYLFLLNFTPRAASVRTIGDGWTRVQDGSRAAPIIRLAPYGFAILRGNV